MDADGQDCRDTRNHSSGLTASLIKTSQAAQSYLSHLFSGLEKCLGQSAQCAHLKAVPGDACLLKVHGQSY